MSSGYPIPGTSHGLVSGYVSHLLRSKAQQEILHSPALSVLHTSWPFLEVLQAPVHVLLASFGKDYVLFDAGAPGREYADFLLPRLETALGDGQLRLIALTHGHSDHVGALEALVQKYPDVQVVFHQDEAPYITGQHTYLVLALQCCTPSRRLTSHLVRCSEKRPYHGWYMSKR